MDLMAGGREKSMGLSIAGRLARLLLVLTSLNITEIMFGLVSLMPMARDRPDPFQYQADAEFHDLEEQAVREHLWPIHSRIPFANADCVAHAYILPTPHGVTGRHPMQGVIFTLGATSASVPRLRGGFN